MLVVKYHVDLTVKAAFVGYLKFRRLSLFNLRLVEIWLTRINLLQRLISRPGVPPEIRLMFTSDDFASSSHSVTVTVEIPNQATFGLTLFFPLLPPSYVPCRCPAPPSSFLPTVFVH